MVEQSAQILSRFSRAAATFVLAAGVSPWSSGKIVEPRSGDTRYDTDSVGTHFDLWRFPSLEALG